MVVARIRDSANARSSGTAGLRWWQTISMSRCSATVLTVCGSVGLVDPGSTFGSPAMVRMSGACPPPAPSTWNARDAPAGRSPSMVRCRRSRPRSASRSAARPAGPTRPRPSAPRRSRPGSSPSPRAPCSRRRRPAPAPRRPPADTVLPLPSSSRLTGNASSARWTCFRCQAPGVTVVALEPSDGPGAAAAQGGQAGRQRLDDLRRREEVHVGVEAAGGEDLALAGDHVGARPDRPEPGRPRRRCRGCRCGRCRRSGRPGCRRRPGRCPSGRGSIALVITVSSAPSAGWSRPWFIDSRIDLPPPNTDSSPPKVRSCSISIHRSVSPSRIWSPAVGPKIAAYVRPARSAPSGLRSHSAWIWMPGTVRRPCRATMPTVREAPGSNRTEVPAGMSSRKPCAAARSKSSAGVHVGQVDVRADLDRPVGGVDDDAARPARPARGRR